MDDIISLSSGSEEDSDIEFVSSSKDNNTHNAFPFITAKLLPVTPVLIDITKHLFPPYGPKHSQKVRKLQCSPIEVIHLNEDSFPCDEQKAENQCVRSTVRSSENVCHMSYTVDLDKDVIYLDPGEGNAGHSRVCAPCRQDRASTEHQNAAESCSNQQNVYKSENFYHQGIPCALDQLNSKDVKEHEHLHIFKNTSGLTHTLQNNDTVEDAQNTKYSPLCPSAAKKDKTLYLSQNSLDKAPSPFSLDSPYYCPSEIDAVLFSDESCMNDNKDHINTIFNLNETESAVLDYVGLLDVKQPAPKSPSQSMFALQTLLLPTSSATSPTHSQPCRQKPTSPTSTEILAGDSPEVGSDPIMESPPSSPVLSFNLNPPSPPPHRETVVLGVKASVSTEDFLSSHNTRETDARAEQDLDSSEADTQEGQHVSLVQFRKLKHLIGGRAKEMAKVEDEDELCQAEPLCRQSLSLVYSTIEENYPEGTLQLLSDLIQPCYFPPRDITAHLLRGILLDPQCPDVLALEAFNLLMRTQKYHPADRTTIPWDWELISSVMTEEDQTKRLRSDVQCLLLQYVLQVLEDDFQCKLSMLQLHLSIANKMLSCDQKLTQVRELLNWLLNAAKQSFCAAKDDEMQQMEQSCYLRMLLIMQRMLLLGMEVDLRPNLSSSKLSEELCKSLNSQAQCRQLRLLLLSTLESNLLRCKLVELLLDQACTQKRQLPMSFKLLLHFLHTSTPAPDPSDGAERWKRWDELLQLVWMLMLSYHEVTTGHLRCNITERFRLSRCPLWTQNDFVTRDAVQEAAEAFLSRAAEDLGHDLPSQMQESLSQLQEHLLSISFY